MRRPSPGPFPARHRAPLRPPPASTPEPPPSLDHLPAVKWHHSNCIRTRRKWEKENIMRRLVGNRAGWDVKEANGPWVWLGRMQLVRHFWCIHRFLCTAPNQQHMNGSSGRPDAVVKIGPWKWPFWRARVGWKKTGTSLCRRRMRRTPQHLRDVRNSQDSGSEVTSPLCGDKVMTLPFVTPHGLGYMVTARCIKFSVKLIFKIQPAGQSFPFKVRLCSEMWSVTKRCGGLSSITRGRHMLNRIDGDDSYSILYYFW